MKLRLSTIYIIYVAVIITLVCCGKARANETINAELNNKSESQTKYKYERKVTDDLLTNTLKAEYPSDQWKVVPRDEVCKPPSPCGKKQEETPTTLHEKLKYECPPCRKCVKEINEINTLRKDITTYRAEIQRLKSQLDEAQARLEEAQDKEPEEKIVEKTVEKLVPDDKKNYLYFSPMYSQDGIKATEQEGEAVYEAQPVESVLFGGGYTRFFEFSQGMDIGIGVGGYVGQTNYGITGQVGVKF